MLLIWNTSVKNLHRVKDTHVTMTAVLLQVIPNANWEEQQRLFKSLVFLHKSYI